MRYIVINDIDGQIVGHTGVGFIWTTDPMLFSYFEDSEAHDFMKTYLTKRWDATNWPKQIVSLSMLPETSLKNYLNYRGIV